MIKKVKTDQLRIGVYVHDFNCTSSKGNKLITQAHIKSEKAIQIIRSWGIDEVYINTEKGLDIKPGKSALEIRQKTDRELRRVVLASQPPIPTAPLKEELSIARKIKEDAITTMTATMNAVANGKAVDLGNAYRLIEKMEQSVSRNRDALLLLTRIRHKDEYTLMHSISVSSLVLAFCNFCGLPYETTIHMAIGALFHDIGKTQIPLSILNKPGKLNPYELEIIQKHTEYSAEAMGFAKDLPFEAFDIALHHHERQDGSGYPHGLKGDAILFPTRVVSICDVFDAMTSNRCYKARIGKVAGLKKLYELTDFHFDKELVYKFISMIGVYPVGTCVKLENDLIGVVTGSTESVTQPVVRLFYNDQTKSAMQIQEINLSKAGINVANYESPANWGADKLLIYRNVISRLDPLH